MTRAEGLRLVARGAATVISSSPLTIQFKKPATMFGPGVSTVVRWPDDFSDGEADVIARVMGGGQ